MELVLVLGGEGDGARRVDVVVSLAPVRAQQVTVAGLQAALATYGRSVGLVPQTSTAALGLRREGDPDDIPPSVRVVDSGLCDGDTVLLRPVGGRSARGRRSGPFAGDSGDEGLATGLVLDVVGGPASGASVPLELGSLTVGRSLRCRLALDDPTLSRRHLALQVADQWGGGLEVALVPDASARNGVVVEGRLLDGPHALLPGELVRAGDSLLVLRTVVGDRVAAGRRGAPGPLPTGRVTVDWAPVPTVTVQRRSLGGVRSAPARQGAGLSAGRRFVRQRDEFYEQVEAMADRVDQALSLERSERHAVAPDLAALRHWADEQRAHPVPDDRSGRTPPGRDHLRPVRVGLGDVASQLTMGVAPGGAVDLRRQAIERLAHHATVTEAPVTLDLDAVGAVGVWGAAAQVRGTTSALVLQAAGVHPPGDLVVAAALGRPNRDHFDWLKWLPHVRSPASPLAGEHVAVGPEAGAALVARLLDVVAERMTPVADGAPAPGWPRLLLVVDDAAELPRRLVDRVVGLPPERGLRVVWFGDSEVVAPRGCGALVHCAGSGQRGALGRKELDLDGVSAGTARTVARSLAALQDPVAAEPGRLPAQVPLLDVVELARPTPEVIADRWQAAAPDTLPVAVGLAVDGVREVDLVRQGPGLLVTGARGSGRTSALVSLAVSAALRLGPERLELVVLDYGPGAGTEPLRALPHVRRWVAAADGPGATREALDEVQAALAGRDPGGPRILVLVDDHAALARQLPWAPAILAELAGGGDPTGAHLVVATGYPVDVPDTLLRRCAVRLALRAPSAEAAMRAVGTPEPASIPAPLRGRGYLRVGAAAPVAVQCPLVGAAFDLNPGAPLPPVEVTPFTLGPSPTEATATSDRPSQMQAVVGLCAEAVRRAPT